MTNLSIEETGDQEANLTSPQQATDFTPEQYPGGLQMPNLIGYRESQGQLVPAAA